MRRGGGSSGSGSRGGDLSKYSLSDEIGRGASGIVYKSDLLPDKVFFNREKLGEFVDGKRYKRLLREMRKGLRTHADGERLKKKAAVRRAKFDEKHEKKKEELKAKRKAKRTLDADKTENTAEIERRQAAFQAKKARRLARKQEAAAQGTT